MFHIVLYQPEIPPNTGNIMRLCANAGATLHLIHPLGFQLDAAKLRRAGMDYRAAVTLHEHADWTRCQHWLAAHLPLSTLYALTTKATVTYTTVTYQPGDVLLLGPETRGLPPSVLADLPAPQQVRIPMRAGNRSLNLANAAAIVLYEAWRQQGFG